MSTPAGVVDGLLAGRYRPTARLAAGAMGEVWRARDVLLDRDVAVKTLRPELADDEVVRARFRAEARSTGRLAHPGIAAVYDVGEDDDGRAWIVLELVEGESLQAVLRREGRLGPERTLDVLAQTAAALQAAHDTGVVHRDVKPGNLLVRRDGVVKVTDFGIASAAGTARLTGTGQVLGTAAYLSPEQAGGGSATPASDLYALGVVAYECLSGSVPFAFDAPVAVLLAHVRTEPPSLPDDVPPPLRELVGRLLAKDPADRPASGRDVVSAAHAVLAGLRAGASGPAGVTAASRAPGLPAASGGTAVLPPVDHAAPAPPRPPRVVRRSRAAGLSSRPGQRWAVSATALLLALLAVVLGLRETSGAPARPSPSPVPTGPGVTTAPSTASSSPAATAPTGAPAVPAPAAPAQEAVPPQEQPAAPAPEQDGGRAQGEQAPEQAEDVAEQAEEDAEQADRTAEQTRQDQEAAEKAREAQEKAADKAEDGGGNGNGGGNGGDRGGGNGGGGNGNGRGKGGDG